MEHDHWIYRNGDHQQLCGDGILQERERGDRYYRLAQDPPESLLHPVESGIQTAGDPAALAAEFPQMVRVARDNQQVVDEAEWIFIAVLPEQALDVIRELTFTPEKKVISLVPMLDFQKVREIAGPLKLLVDVVPLPFCSRGTGPVVLNPPVDEVKELLSAIGTVVAVERPEQMALLRTVTALMSPYYMLLAKMVGWCCDNGLDEPTARAYVTSFTGALSQVAAAWPGR